MDPILTLPEINKRLLDLEKFQEDQIRQQLNRPLDDTTQRIIREILQSSTVGMTLVETAALTDDFTISDLKGDTDLMYKLFLISSSATPHSITLRFNADGGGNYQNATHWYSKQNAVTDHDVQTTTGDAAINLSYITQKIYVGEVLINAQSGFKRLAQSRFDGVDGSANYYDIISNMGIWTNTADEITSLTVLFSAATQGMYSLYKV